MTENITFFATTPKGIELLLADELRALGATEAKETRAGVQFQGPLALAYRTASCFRWRNSRPRPPRRCMKA